MAVWDQLSTSGYNNIVTYSGDVFATATATLNGDGSYTMAPSTGVNWTQDTSIVGGAGSPELISIEVLDDTAGILEFDIVQANGNSETVYGQVIGWNGWIIGFQAYQNYDSSTGILSGAVSGVPYFYVSAAPLVSGAAPVDGTNVSLTNTEVPSFLDPQFPPDTQPLLLNNSGSIAPASNSALLAPYASLVGTTLSSDNVSAIGEISQDPSSLTITAVSSPLTETFTTAFGSQTVTVVNAYNDAQVIELQYTKNGTTVDVYGKLIGQYDDKGAGDGVLLFQTYGTFDSVTNTLTHYGSDASLPYFLLSEQSLAATGGMPETTANGNENDFNPTANPGASGVYTPFGLGPSLLNLDDTLLGKTFSSDLFETTTASIDSGSYQLTQIHSDRHNWTNSSNVTVGGQGTAEQVTVSAVYDAYQVVEFNITGGPNGSQTVYGQVLGWNALEIGFKAYSSFDPSTGALSGVIAGVPNFALAEAGSVVDGFNLDPFVIPQNSVDQPFFLDPGTPSTNLDLTALMGFSPDTHDVSIVGAVQQDPTTLALTALATVSNTTFADTTSASQFTGGGQPGTLEIANVYNQYQAIEIQYTDNAGNVDYDQFAKVIGYNADSLLLQVLGASGEFDPTTGAWTPITGNESNPFLIISDASLSATNGLPSDNVFTSNGPLLPLGVATLCFCAGTLIATPVGETEVERLQVGDSVITHRGVARRIVWIGSGQVMVTRGRRSAATPIIIRKGALADNVPHQDLHVTKGHSFYMDDVLIPVEFLVNHRSIIWNDMAQEVTIYHVELETHDVLLANGAPAESYRDDGNRWLFRNANNSWHLPPQEPCAPIMTGGPVVDAAWRRLLDRAGPRPGLALTQDPDLHLLVDGHRIEAAMQDDLTAVFELPKSFQSIRIGSRSAVPAELGLARDPRELGVALRRIVLRRGTWFFTIRANDPALTNGFHEFEADRSIRWTNGDAELPATHLKPEARPQELVLVLGGTAHYIDDGFRASRAA